MPSGVGDREMMGVATEEELKDLEGQMGDLERNEAEPEAEDGEGQLRTTVERR